MTEPIVLLPEGTVGRRIQDEFSKTKNFESVPVNGIATNEELTDIVQSLFATVQRSLLWIVEAIDNPQIGS
jgi:hypothetical protein